jgi:hypothetical protein
MIVLLVQHDLLMCTHFTTMACSPFGVASYMRLVCHGPQQMGKIKGCHSLSGVLFEGYSISKLTLEVSMAYN